MDETERACYHFHRHNLSASVDESDVFQKADLKRQLLAQNFYASLTLSSNAATCLLLEEDLDSYSSLVDSRTSGSVNNYADAALSLASHCKSESKEWKSNLKSCKQEVSSLVDQMKCSECRDWKPPEDLLRVLSQTSNSSGTTVSMLTLRKLPDKSNFLPTEPLKLPALRKDALPANLPVAKTIATSDVLETNFKANECVDSLDLPCDFKVFGKTNPAPAIQPQSNFRTDFKGNKNANETSSDFSKYFPKRPLATSTATDPGTCWNTSAMPTNFRKDPANFEKEFTGSGKCFAPDGPRNNAPEKFRRDFEKPTRGENFGSSRGRDAPYSGTRKSADERRKNYLQSDAGTSSTAANFFKTARDELVEQNAKKNNNGRDGGYNDGYGRGSYNNENNPGQSRGNNLQYGVQKRSLGTARRAGVLNKFVPPVRPSEEDDYSGSRDGGKNHTAADNDGELDERLKGIDPKMIELIRNEIMDISAPVSWDDIAGLEFAKSTIQEIVVWPMLRPDIFTGLRKPPKGLLLFGPPGTGKTLIGKCIASQSQSTFFSISASSLTSKWIGDGEKMVRALFAVAKCHQPAVVFIDEIDSLLTQRSDTEHESSRRIKTEFLVQLDGAGTGDEERILVVGATNRPQELDEAARRRLVKRLYIPLPEFEARRQIVERLMSTERSALSPEEINEIAKLSDGYSGADMKNLCQEASLGPIRSLSFAAMHQITADQVRPVSFDDFRMALNRVRASVSKKDLDQYVAWDQTYGMSGANF